MTPLSQAAVASPAVLAARIYGAMSVLSLGAIFLRSGGISPTIAILADDRGLRESLILGLGVGLILALISRVLVRIVEQVNRLELELSRAIGPISTAGATKLAIWSGVGEELLFRGVLQPWLGPVVATALFAIAHLGPGARFWAWACWAGAAGIAFACMTTHTGNLLAAIVAHVTVNYLGLSWLAARNAEGSARAESSGERLLPRG